MLLTDLDVFNMNRNIKYLVLVINILNGHQNNDVTNILDTVYPESVILSNG